MMCFINLVLYVMIIQLLLDYELNSSLLCHSYLYFCMAFDSNKNSGNYIIIVFRQVLEVVAGCKGITDIEGLSKTLYHNTCR
jgi:hypothetical protein